MGIVRDLYYARKMSAGLKLPAPTVALLIKRLRLAAAMGGGVTKTVSGTMVHITDALAKAALSVLASIEPIQDLHGYANPWPAGGGVNKYDKSADYYGQGKFWNSSTGALKPSDDYYGSPKIPITPNTQYSRTAGASANIFYDSNGDYLSTTFTGGAFTSPANAYYVTFNIANNVNHDTVQFEQGASLSAYSPYANICPISGRTGLSVYVSPTQNVADATTYSVDWTTQAGTVYHGTVDVVSGELTVDMVNIPSYNGETINEPWLSSMDAYAEGTTPTIGAQVVYTLATPLTYQLTPQEVQMLLGENYVWSSYGDTVSVTYYAEGNANTLQSLNILLGGRYSNPKTADDVSDKEALEIILGGNK